MLSLILPTYNESQNLEPLLRELTTALAGIDYEVMVVDDDSPDRTWEKAEQLGMHVIRRIGRRGLSSAVVEGLQAATGDALAVMDADLQHDPRLIPRMLDAINGGADLVIGSRYTSGGSVGNWNIFRKLLSSSGTLVTRIALRRNVTDPLSGFFLIRRDTAEPLLQDFHPRGFKILLDLLIRLPQDARVQEIPFVFRTRMAGESKLNFGVHLAVLKTLTPLLLKRLSTWVFVLLCLGLSIVFAFKIRALWPLYTQSQVRHRAQAVLEHTAESHGWLLSDLSLEEVDPAGITVLHREHLRGRDPLECLRLSLEFSIVSPCAGS